MSKFLLDEPSLQVQPSLAIAIGLNEAIALQQLHWVLQNPAMGKIVDGKKYVHMSYKEWRKGHFPFWSEATIQRTFDVLIKKKLVESRGDLNALSFDRTHWYTINHAEVAKVEESLKTNERIIEHSKMIDGHRKMKDASRQNETTIPDTSLPESSAPEPSSAGGANPAPPTDKESPKLPDSPPVVKAKEEIRAILEGQNCGAHPAVSDAMIDKREYRERVGAAFAAVFRHDGPSQNDKNAAGKLFDLRFPIARSLQFLAYAANGGGERYRTTTTKDGKALTAYHVVNDMDDWRKSGYPAFGSRDDVTQAALSMMPNLGAG